MLSSQIFQPKTMDDLMQDARMQIPLLGDEWTNFNPSDPAVTMLEVLSQMSIMQEQSILMMPPRVQERLFQMAGFVRQNARSSRVLLKAENVENQISLPMGQKFYVGDMCFETGKEHTIGDRKIIGIYTGKEESLKDISYVLDPDMPIKASIFDKIPEEGMQLYILCNALGKAAEELIFYLQLEEPYIRNPIEESQPFSAVEWECYTSAGFVPLKVMDHTDGFLRSGELRIKLPRQKVAEYDGLPESGYVIRATLKKAAYDVPPKLISAAGFLMEVWQKETEAVCYTFDGKKTIRLNSTTASYGYFTIYVREEDEEHYHRYVPGEEHQQGRYYRLSRKGQYDFQFEFDKEQFGYEPGNSANAIKFVAYNEETMRKFHLGTIYGYESQTMELPVDNIVKDSFSVIARRIDENGEEIYDFIRPDSEKENEFSYTIVDGEGVLRIDNARDFVGAEILLCTCAKLEGEYGNIRAGSTFVPAGVELGATFVNPSEGSGGRLQETLSQLRSRFIQDISDRYTAVEAADYEKIVMTTPGLCIHKVHAVMDKKSNQVQIAVKPYGMDELPKMSPIYEKAIRKRLDERRLLTTSIALLQPEYVPVSVHGIIYVKPHYGNARQQIENVIRSNLDYVNTDKGFGETMNFDVLFHSIESLDCVDFIYELSAFVQNSQAATKQGMDIVPLPQSLLIPGEFHLELNSLE